ncbi:hypothetical protein [Oceanicella sp. SM1341]|uniref:hypothetical protein n=1 Tax=Oceanicella sp. SM1341 TaxID=1548889 RepID=UPI000E4958A6|nr:hypothetical protein [Oceanicella sp. SM1341]
MADTLSPASIARLTDLADRAFANRRARLGAATAAQQAAEAALATHLARRAPALRAPDTDPKVLEAWLVWHGQETTRLEARIAAARREAAARRADAAEAFARCRAVAMLAKRAEAGERRRRERAEERALSMLMAGRGGKMLGLLD